MATILKGYRCVTTVAAICYLKIYLIVLAQYSQLILQSVIAEGVGRISQKTFAFEGENVFAFTISLVDAEHRLNVHHSPESSL